MTSMKVGTSILRHNDIKVGHWKNWWQSLWWSKDALKLSRRILTGEVVGVWFVCQDGW